MQPFYGKYRMVKAMTVLSTSHANWGGGGGYSTRLIVIYSGACTCLASALSHLKPTDIKGRSISYLRRSYSAHTNTHTHKHTTLTHIPTHTHTHTHTYTHTQTHTHTHSHTHKCAHTQTHTRIQTHTHTHTHEHTNTHLLRSYIRSPVGSHAPLVGRPCSCTPPIAIFTPAAAPALSSRLLPAVRTSIPPALATAKDTARWRGWWC